MNKSGHIAVSSMFGALAGVAVGAPPAVVLACVPLGGVSGLGPDIDGHNSTVTKSLGPITKFLHKLVAGFSGWIYERTKTSDDTAEAGGRHRGFTHTLVCTGLVGAAAFLAAWFGLPHLGVPTEHAAALALAVSFGWAGHLVGDALTANGVAAFWPIPIAGERWYGVSLPSVLSITGDGPAEKVFAFLSWTAVSALLIASGVDYAGYLELPTLSTALA